MHYRGLPNHYFAAMQVPALVLSFRMRCRSAWYRFDARLYVEDSARLADLFGKCARMTHAPLLEWALYARPLRSRCGKVWI